MKIRKKPNIILLLLMQTLTKTSNSLQKTDFDILHFLRDVLVYTNEQIELENKVSGTAQSAKEDIKILDNLVKSLKSLFNIVFDLLDENEQSIIRPEFQRFLNNLQDYRDDLELLTEEDFWQEINAVYQGTQNKNNYIDYKTFDNRL